MRIAVDAMGGDHAPLEIILGALDAMKEYSEIDLIFVGKKEEIERYIEQEVLDAEGQKVTIVDCDEVIGMDEHPALAYRKKKGASISVATGLVREKKADAVISAGNTGAQMVAALFKLGRLKGVDRPAICTVIPALTGPKVLLDVGANADCKPENLVQFAIMGSVYAEKIVGIKMPKVALISNGEEATKGNDLVQKAYEILKNESSVQFLGNVEGRDVLMGKADVMVCDGFVGNTILKVIEGTAGAIFTLLKEEISKTSRGKMGAVLLKPAFEGIKARLDYSEHGGAPLLGVDGISIICHGSSKAPAIKNAIRVAIECYNNNFVSALQEGIVFHG